MSFSYHVTPALVWVALVCATAGIAHESEVLTLTGMAIGIATGTWAMLRG